MKQKLITAGVLAGFLLLTLVFFSLPVLFPPDSFTYIGNAEFFAGLGSRYNMVRGPVLPFALMCAFKLFGHSGDGLLVLLFVVYLLFTLASCYILSRLLHTSGPAALLCSLLIVLNPLILAFAHIILTEFFAMAILAIFAALWLLLDHLLHTQKWHRLHLLRAALVFYFTMLLYGTKQMHAFLVPVFAISFYILEWIRSRKARHLLGIPLVALAFSAGLLCFSNLWNISLPSIIEKNEAAPEIADEELSYVAADYTNGYSGGDSIKGFAFWAVADGLRFFVPAVHEDVVAVRVYDNDFQNVIDTYEVVYDPGISGTIRYFFEAVRHAPLQVLNGYTKSYLVTAGALRPLVRNGDYKHCPTNHAVTLDHWEGEIVYFSQFFKYEHADRNEALPLIDGEALSPMQKRFGEATVSGGLITNILFNTFLYDLSQILHTTAAVLALPLLLLSFVLILLGKKNDLLTVLFLTSFNIFFNLLVIALIGQPIDRYTFPALLYSAILVSASLYTVYGLLKKLVLNVRKRKVTPVGSAS